MVKMRMAREREMAEMLRTGGVGGQLEKKFECWAETDPRSDPRPDPRSDLKKDSNLFVATPPEKQRPERNEEVIFFLLLHAS